MGALPTQSPQPEPGAEALPRSLYGDHSFESAAHRMFDLLHGQSVALMTVIGAGLGMPAAVTQALCDTRTPGPLEYTPSVLRLYRYIGGREPDVACGVHADIGLLTLSPRADLPGLRHQRCIH